MEEKVNGFRVFVRTDGRAKRLNEVSAKTILSMHLPKFGDGERQDE